MDFVILRKLYWQNTSLHQRMFFHQQGSAKPCCYLFFDVTYPSCSLSSSTGCQLQWENHFAPHTGWQWKAEAQSPTRQGKSPAASKRAAVVSSSSFHLQFKLLAHRHKLENGSKSRITETKLLALKLILRLQPLQALLREFLVVPKPLRGFTAYMAKARKLPGEFYAEYQHYRQGSLPFQVLPLSLLQKMKVSHQMGILLIVNNRDLLEKCNLRSYISQEKEKITSPSQTNNELHFC